MAVTSVSNYHRLSLEEKKRADKILHPYKTMIYAEVEEDKPEKKKK